MKIKKPKSKKLNSKARESNSIMSLFGAWKDVDTEAMIKYIYEGRKDKGEIKRKLPSLK
ncbi:MAG: hypothetical protein AAB656_02965 [Patescibacteria group bacterium]